MATPTTAAEMELFKDMMKQGVLTPTAFERLAKDMVVADPSIHNHSGIASPASVLGHKLWSDKAGQQMKKNGDYVKIASGQAPVVTPKGNYMPRKEELMRVLGVRLRVPEGEMHRMDFIDFHVGKDKVYVFIVKNDMPVTLEDDLTLFPSDTLITAIKLLEG